MFFLLKRALIKFAMRILGLTRGTELSSWQANKRLFNHHLLLRLGDASHSGKILKKAPTEEI